MFCSHTLIDSLHSLIHRGFSYEGRLFLHPEGNFYPQGLCPHISMLLVACLLAICTLAVACLYSIHIPLVPYVYSIVSYVFLLNYCQGLTAVNKQAISCGQKRSQP